MESPILTMSKTRTEKDESSHLVDVEANDVQRVIPLSACETLPKYGTTNSEHVSSEKNFPGASNNTSDDNAISNRTGTSTIRELQGYAIIFTSACFLGITATAIRSSQTNYGYDAFQTVNLLGTQLTIYSTMYIICFSSFTKIFSSFTYELYFKLIMRGIVGTLTIFAFSSALGLLPAGYAISILYIGPIITILLSSVILSERPGLSCYFAAIIAFLGVLLVSHQSSTSPISMFGVAIALLGAVCGAFIPIAVRALVSSAHFITSPLSLGFTSFIVTSCLGSYVSLPSVVKDGNKELIFASILPGLSSFFGQLLLSIGFKFCRASSGAVIRSLEIPVAYISAVIMLHEHPLPIRLLGSGVILIATIMVTMGKVYGF